jgi:hypothetical protein
MYPQLVACFVVFLTSFVFYNRLLKLYAQIFFYSLRFGFAAWGTEGSVGSKCTLGMLPSACLHSSVYQRQWWPRRRAQPLQRGALR